MYRILTQKGTAAEKSLGKRLGLSNSARNFGFGRARTNGGKFHTFCEVLAKPLPKNMARTAKIEQLEG